MHHASHTVSYDLTSNERRMQEANKRYKELEGKVSKIEPKHRQGSYVL
jgi:hypothetical protein